MKRRNFLTALFAAPFAPWREILTGIRTKLPWTTPMIEHLPPGRVDCLDLDNWGAITKLSNSNGVFDVGDLITIYNSRGELTTEVYKVVAREDSNILVVREDHRIRENPYIPADWENLKRHA